MQSNVDCLDVFWKLLFLWFFFNVGTQMLHIFIVSGIVVGFGHYFFINCFSLTCFDSNKVPDMSLFFKWFSFLVYDYLTFCVFLFTL